MKGAESSIATAVLDTGRNEVSSGGLRGFLKSILEFMPWKAALVVALMLGVTATSGFGLLMLIPMLGTVGLDVQDGNLGRVAEFMLGGFATFGLQPTVATVIVLYVLIVTANASLSRWQSIAATSLYQGFVVQLRQRLYRAITDADWLFFSRHRSSTFTHVLTNELQRVGGATSAFVSLLVKVILAAVYLSLALFLSFTMTLMVIACGLVLSLLLLRRTRLGREKGKAVSEAYEDLYSAISEHLAGMKISKSYGVEDHHVDMFAERADHTAKKHIDVVRNNADLSYWLNVGSVVILATILYVALEILALPLATILVLLFLFARLVPMFTGIQRGYQSFLNNLPAFDHVMAVQGRCEASAEPSAPEERLDLERSIRLEGVSFSYEGDGTAPALERVDMAIPAGKTAAVVGPSGSGKSTLADLVVGLIAPDAGEVLIDGEALTAEKRRGWRKQIGYVAQDTFLFHDSVRANLLVARPEAGEEELWQALESAAAADFVAALPERLDTVLGDRGVRLSGGERQRIALARALLRRPAMLLLDEATSALDAENEKHIQHAVEKLRGQMTILVIAHRLSTVRNADIIHVLDRGRLVESGDWQTLYRQEGGRFRALCEAQGIRSQSWMATR